MKIIGNREPACLWGSQVEVGAEALNIRSRMCSRQPNRYGRLADKFLGNGKYGLLHSTGNLSRGERKRVVKALDFVVDGSRRDQIVNLLVSESLSDLGISVFDTTQSDSLTQKAQEEKRKIEDRLASLSKNASAVRVAI